MGEQTPIGEFEQLVVLAALRLGDEAYPAAIRREIEERTGRSASRGAVYTTLDRLENKGMLSSALGAPLPERGGKPRRYYQVEEQGLEALREARRALERMWSGLEAELGGETA